MTDREPLTWADLPEGPAPALSQPTFWDLFHRDLIRASRPTTVQENDR